jgi:Fe-S-cluster containining protein
MKSCCMDYNCIQCCLETSMPLSNRDIKRISRLGFDTNFFVIERDGWLQLKNHDGRCVFHSGKICSIYKNRPEGCRSYPIIYDKDENRAVLDEDCPHRDKFQMPEIAIKELLDIVSKLEREVNEREKHEK